MKLLNKFLISAAALSMVACSSMSVDEDEAVAGNFPDDFDKAVYIQLHPELVSLQVRDYVSDYNTGVKDAAAGNAAAKDGFTADENAFLEDTASLHKIYADMTLAGFGEDKWQEAWAPIEKDSLYFHTAQVFTVLNYKEVSAEGDTSELKKIFGPITVTYDTEDTTKIVSAKGKSDTTETAEDVSLTFSETVFLMTGKQMGTTKTDTTSIDTIPVSIPGSISKVNMNFLKNFNFVDTNDDYAKLKAIPLDSMAIAYQYVMFGKDHGWAYRKCKDSEKNNEPKVDDVYPDTKLYCADDAGTVREIK